MARTLQRTYKCHHAKPVNHKPFGKLEQLDIPGQRWSRIGIDFIKLPTSTGGHDAIVYIIHLTKRAHFLPLTEKGLTAEAFSKIFYDFYIRLHGIPDTIVV